MHRRVSAKFVYSTRRVWRAAEEAASFQIEFHIASLCEGQHRQGVRQPVGERPTSTSSKTATTKTSNVEFLHPTTTPGRSDLRMSVGQNTRISPSCSTMLATTSAGSASRRILAASVVLEPIRRAFAGATHVTVSSNHDGSVVALTKAVSLLARSTTGRKMDKKTSVKATTPFAARIYSQVVSHLVPEVPSNTSGNVPQLRTRLQRWQAHRGV